MILADDSSVNTDICQNSKVGRRYNTEAKIQH